MPYKTITALVCITALLITAILNGIDGVLLSAGIALLAGLGGYEAQKLAIFKRHKHDNHEPPDS